MTGFSDGYGQRNIDNKSFGLLARIDWNINQNHKLALRYQHNNSYDDNYGVGSTSYMFENSGYRMNNKTNSIVAELNSHLGQNLYNELRASASFIRDHRDVAYQDLPSKSATFRHRMAPTSRPTSVRNILPEPTTWIRTSIPSKTTFPGIWVTTR